MPGLGGKAPAKPGSGWRNGKEWQRRTKSNTCSFNHSVTVPHFSQQRGISQLFKLEGAFSVKPHALEVA
jgi:hypothetical protein